jgi:hypothetical protein
MPSSGASSKRRSQKSCSSAAFESPDRHASRVGEGAWSSLEARVQIMPRRGSALVFGEGPALHGARLSQRGGGELRELDVGADAPAPPRQVAQTTHEPIHHVGELERVRWRSGGPTIVTGGVA